MLRYAISNEKARWQGWAYISALFFAQLLLGLCIQHKDFALIKLGTRVRAALSTCISNKVLLIYMHDLHYPVDYLTTVFFCFSPCFYHLMDVAISVLAK